MSVLDEVLEFVDYVLVMSVNPGFGAQRFIPNTLRKIRALDLKRRELGVQFAIEIDGGVSPENIGDVVRAGCDWVVAGSSIFRECRSGRNRDTNATAGARGPACPRLRLRVVFRIQIMKFSSD